MDQHKQVGEMPTGASSNWSETSTEINCNYLAQDLWQSQNNRIFDVLPVNQQPVAFF